MGGLVRGVWSTGLGELLVNKGDFAPAHALLKEGYDIRRAGLPGGHWQTAISAGALGTCLTRMRRFEEAEPLLLGSHDNLQTTFGTQHGNNTRAREGLIDLYEAWGKPDKAQQFEPGPATP